MLKLSAQQRRQAAIMQFDYEVQNLYRKFDQVDDLESCDEVIEKATELLDDMTSYFGDDCGNLSPFQSAHYIQKQAIDKSYEFMK